MKKKLVIIILSILVVLAILTVPIPGGQMKDGGTTVYNALTYRVVNWRRIMDSSLYQQTRVYWLADRYKDLDTLWQEELDAMTHRVTEPDANDPEETQVFLAKIMEMQDNWVLVEPVEGEPERNSCTQISFGTATLDDLRVEVGSYVHVFYDGMIMESYPAQIHASQWMVATDLRQFPYEGQWLDPEDMEANSYGIAEDLHIDAIYADCFFATPVIPMPYQVKVNGVLSEDWCVGDQIMLTCENIRRSGDGNRVEVDLVKVEASDFELEPGMAYKPVLYLYPEEETAVQVRLTPRQGFTCTYPAYDDGWFVTAAPDGTLTDANGQTYNYLYWEGNTGVDYAITEGFCVKGEDTAAFLEEALEKLGLTRREANEFIVYWLPLMEANPYNLISFQTDAYTAAAPLEIIPTPDTLIRVFMTYQASDIPVELPEQELTAPERKGFTAVEWGGSEI